MKKYSGYTLIEMMALLAVIAVVLAVGVPMLNVFFQGNRMISNTNEIVAGLHIARSEAIKQDQRITICQSSDQATCTGSGQWEDGYIVFQDHLGGAPGNQTVDSGERILRVNAGAQGKQVTIRSDDGSTNVIENAVTFTSRGLPKATNGVSVSGTFRICDSRGLQTTGDGTTTVARAVTLSPSGRVRSSNLLANIASCP